MPLSSAATRTVRAHRQDSWGGSGSVVGLVAGEARCLLRQGALPRHVLKVPPKIDGLLRYPCVEAEPVPNVPEFGEVPRLISAGHPFGGAWQLGNWFGHVGFPGGSPTAAFFGRSKAFSTASA